MTHQSSETPPVTPAPDEEVKAAIERLKEAAEKATPGTWTAQENVTGVIGWVVRAVYRAPDGSRVTAWPLMATCGGQPNEANARYAALANPSAILSLISSYEERGREIERTKNRTAAALSDVDRHYASLSQAQDRIYRLERCLADALAGWRYIRQHHGDLYGVGWDRVETTAEALLSTPKGSDEA